MAFVHKHPLSTGLCPLSSRIGRRGPRSTGAHDLFPEISAQLLGIEYISYYDIKPRTPSKLLELHSADRGRPLTRRLHRRTQSFLDRGHRDGRRDRQRRRWHPSFALKRVKDVMTKDVRTISASLTLRGAVLVGYLGWKDLIRSQAGRFEEESRSAFLGLGRRRAGNSVKCRRLLHRHFSEGGTFLGPARGEHIYWIARMRPVFGWQLIYS
jgi:hypothetical protein